MLGVGAQFPQYKLKALVRSHADASEAFQTLSNNNFSGSWKLYFFWPKDFTFICPTEITAFGDMQQQFLDRKCQIIGGSTDSDFVHLAWFSQHPELAEKVRFPILSDIKRELSDALGIIDPTEGVCQRATFIVDPQEKIRYVSVTDLSVGRNSEEVLRVLDALQNGGLCPVNWKSGQATLQPGSAKK